MTKVVTKVKRPQQGGLTPHFVRTVTRPGRYGDGHGGFGLSLYVKPAAKGRLSKTWNQRLPIEAGQRDTGLGKYPEVPLHSARQKALDNWQRVKAGEDILATLAALAPPIPTPTVSEMFDAVIATRRQGWRTKTTETAWRRYQRKCKPILDKPVSEVTKADVNAIISTPSGTKSPPTGQKNPHRPARRYGKGHHPRPSHLTIQHYRASPKAWANRSPRPITYPSVTPDSARSFAYSKMLTPHGQSRRACFS